MLRQLAWARVGGGWKCVQEKLDFRDRWDCGTGTGEVMEDR